MYTGFSINSFPFRHFHKVKVFINSEKSPDISSPLWFKKWSPKKHEKINTNVHNFSAISNKKLTELPTKNKYLERGQGKRLYSHSQHRLVTTFTGVEGLWITVQVKIRQQIRQTVHISSHNKHYVFMPIQYAQDLTQPDGQNNAGTSHLQRTELFDCLNVSVAIPSCQTHGVMDEGENLLFVLAALMWNEWDDADVDTYFVDRIRATIRP